MSGSWDFGGGVTPSGGQDSWSDLAAPSQSVESFAASGYGSDPPGDSAPAGAGSSAPVTWLAAGVMAAAVAICVGLLSRSVNLAVGAWALGGPVAIGLLAVFVTTDNTARANPWYAESAVSVWGRRALVVFALVAVALNAWTIADHVARAGF